MKMRIFSILLIIALITGMMQALADTADVNSGTGFTDMPDNWSTAALKNAVANGLLSGYGGKIMPNENLTRAQMSVIINRIFGTTKEADLSSYIDVVKTAWYYSDMAKAVYMKTLEGSDNKLYPDRNITREEVCTVIAKAFKLSVGAAGSELDKFTDGALVSMWAKEGIVSLIAAGYIKGSNGKLNPKQNMTRSEFAQLLDNIIKHYIKKAGTYTSDMNGNVMINVSGVTLKGIKITGDLIIGDGVEDGDITLEGVVITGRTVIRGGSNIKVIGNSNTQTISIARVEGIAGVYVQDGSQVGEIIVAGNDGVIIGGIIQSVKVTASEVKVTISDAKIALCIVTGENVGVTVAEGAEIEDVIVNGKGAVISGKGDVGKVEANADNLTVSTKGTKVIISEGITGIKVEDSSDSETDFDTSSHNNSGQSKVHYKLTVTAKPEAAGTVSDSANYRAGGRAVLTTELKAGADYQFINWTLNGRVVSTSLSFEYTMPSSNVTLVANYIPKGSIPVATASELYNISNGLEKDYVQVADIDLNISPYNNGTGWTPIGDNSKRFKGTYTGNDYKIKNLYINSETTDNAGLFGVTENACLVNVNLENSNISARYNAGGLAGTCYGGSVTDCSVNGTLKGIFKVGGLVGLNKDGSISKSHSSGKVEGDYIVGGIAGENSNLGTLTYCSSDADVVGYYLVGGLLGENIGNVKDCFATGCVTAQKIDVSLPGVQAARADSFSALYEAIATQPEAAKTLTSAAIELMGEAGDMSSSDVQAARAGSFSTLYGAIASKPEVSDILIKAAIELTGEAGDMSSSEVQAARAASFSTLYEAIAEQPEVAKTLIDTALKLTGDEADMSSPEVQAARAKSFSTLYIAMSRQPEAAETITGAAIELTGEAGDMSSSEVQADRALGLSGLYEAIARQPEMEEILIQTAIELTGGAGNMTSSEVQAARAESFSTLYEAIARQPEAAKIIITAAKGLTGEAGDMSSVEVQAARAESFSALYESIARQPEATDILTGAAIELTGQPGDMSSAEVQAARVASFSALYEAISRQPEAAETLIKAAKQLTGEAGDMSSPEVQAARVASFSALYESIARQPEAADTLIEAAIELTGEAGDMSSPEIQTARAESFSALYEAIAKQPEVADTLIEAAIELTGEAGDMSSPEVQAARIKGISGLYSAIGINPPVTTTLTESAIKLVGEAGDISSPEVQVARAASFSTLYEAIANKPEVVDTLIAVA